MDSLIIGIGSNIADRLSYLQTAKRELQKFFTLIDESRIYESSPVDYLEQSFFLNQVLEFQKASYTPSQILGITQEIEKNMGRIKTIPKGPRNIDIDILFIGIQIIDDDDLQIPHPQVFKRSFTVIPLQDLKNFNRLQSFYFFPKSFKDQTCTIYSPS